MVCCIWLALYGCVPWGIAARALAADGQPTIPTTHPTHPTPQVSQWPASSRWDRPYLAAAFKDQPVVVGDMPMSFDTYCRYSDANSDELPLYLFDKTFPQTAPHLAADYTVGAERGGGEWCAVELWDGAT